MNFHLPPDPEEDLPERWGCPKLSGFGAGWFVDWYDARGNLTGATMAKGDVLQWIKANPGPIAEMQRQLADWLYRIDKYIPY